MRWNLITYKEYTEEEGQRPHMMEARQPTIETR
jgi:hypothetical protein